MHSFAIIFFLISVQFTFVTVHFVTHFGMFYETLKQRVTQSVKAKSENYYLHTCFFFNLHYLLLYIDNALSCSCIKRYMTNF